MNAIESQQVCSSCEKAIRHGVGNLGHVPALLKRIINEELWRERKVENGEVVRLNSFRELITSKPYKGWGEDPAKIEAVIRDDPEALAAWREAMKEQTHNRGNQHTGGKDDNVMAANQGNSRSYTVSRLQKQRPDLFERVKVGELSANAAAVEAGFRKVKTPYEQLQHWWKKADETQRCVFRLWIDGELEPKE